MAKKRLCHSTAATFLLLGGVELPASLPLGEGRADVFTQQRRKIGMSSSSIRHVAARLG